MLQPVHSEQWQARGGLPVQQPWTEIEFTHTAETADDFIAADCLTLNTGADGFLLSEYAQQVLGPLLLAAGELWPVRVLGQPYWWLNCMALVEALDRKKTDADWSVVKGEWGSFSWISTTRRLAFRPSRVKQAPVLFRIPEYPQGVLFAQEPLRAAVEKHELTGFRFDPVWSSRDGGILDPAGIGFRGMFEPAASDDLEQRRRAARELLAQRSRKLGN